MKLFSLSFLFFIFPQILLAEETVFRVDPETATLEIERVEFRHQGDDVLVRKFTRSEKERGLFGPGWCSNIDKQLIGVESVNPKVLELRECGSKKSRTFHKILEAWVEDTSSSRILKRSDGRWELVEMPYPTFRFDGRLDSYQVGNHRWYVRRDSSGRAEALDNLREKPVRFRRNLSGDLDGIMDVRGRRVVGYEFGAALASLESAEFGEIRETYEYDADGNILKLKRTSLTKSRSNQATIGNQLAFGPRVWRFSYTTPERLASAQEPDGCTSQWIFERSGPTAIARETRSCHQKAEASSGPVPVKAVPSKNANGLAGQVPRTVAAFVTATKSKPVTPNGKRDLSSPEIEIQKPGPMGIGKERAKVSVDLQGLPVSFLIEGPSPRRLEILREEGSGSVVLLRSAGTEVPFRKRPREYSSRQLELLDEYEEWMAAWSSR